MSFADAFRMADFAGKQAGVVSRLVEEFHRLLVRIKPAVFNRPRTLRVEERLALGPKKTLTVICCRGERFLVASGVDTITAVLPLAGARRHRAAKRKMNARAR